MSAQHGTYLRYNAGCRCDGCRNANRERIASDRRKRIAKGLPVGDPRHGDPVAATNWGCRCDLCRAARKTRNSEYYASRNGELTEPRWTAEEDDILRAFPAARAAELPGRTRGAVYARRARLGLTPKAES